MSLYLRRHKASLCLAGGLAAGFLIGFVGRGILSGTGQGKPVAKRSSEIKQVVAKKPVASPFKEFYVAADGTANGDGSKSRPWDLQTALGGPRSVGPGDTIWLRGGTYRGGIFSQLEGTSGAPITVAAYPGEYVIIDIYDGKPDNLLSFNITGSYTVFRDFEVLCSDTSIRVSKEEGSRPRDIARGGISVRGAHNQFINLIVHDLGSGVGFWSDGAGGEIYGCLIFNNGWTGPRRPHGHGVYVQNRFDVKRIVDCVIFNQYRYGIHGYGSDQAFLKNIHVEGNAVFNNGAAVGNEYFPSPDILLGGEVPAENMTVVHNYTFQNSENGMVDFGYPWGPVNKDIVLENNYFVSNLRFLKPWEKAVVRNNTFFSRQGRVVDVPLPENYSAENYKWDENTYNTTTGTFGYKGEARSWVDWRAESGFDVDSQMSEEPPQKSSVFVRRNKHEKGRATLIVYNWGLDESVPIDLAKIVANGEKYSIRNVVNLFEEPILSGTHDGKIVQLPMRTTRATRPIGEPNDDPVITGPSFGVFLVTTKTPWHARKLGRSAETQQSADVAGLRKTRRNQ